MPSEYLVHEKPSGATKRRRSRRVIPVPQYLRRAASLVRRRRRGLFGSLKAPFSSVTEAWAWVERTAGEERRRIQDAGMAMELREVERMARRCRQAGHVMRLEVLAFVAALPDEGYYSRHPVPCGGKLEEVHAAVQELARLISLTISRPAGDRDFPELIELIHSDTSAPAAAFAYLMADVPPPGSGVRTAWVLAYVERHGAPPGGGPGRPRKDAKVSGGAYWRACAEAIAGAGESMTAEQARCLYKAARTTAARGGRA